MLCFVIYARQCLSQDTRQISGYNKLKSNQMSLCCTLQRRRTPSAARVLRSTVAPFQNYPAKSSDAGLEGGCFFSVTVSAQRGKLPWVSWLHISRMNELNWKTNSLQRRDVFFSLFLGQIYFHSHIYRVRDLKGLVSLNRDVA